MLESHRIQFVSCWLLTTAMEYPTAQSTGLHQEIGRLGEVTSTQKIGQSHKDSCQVSMEDVPRPPNAIITIYWLHCV